MYYSKICCIAEFFGGGTGLRGVFQTLVFWMFYNTNSLNIKYYCTKLIINICKQNKKYQCLQRTFILSLVKT